MLLTTFSTVLTPFPCALSLLNRIGFHPPLLQPAPYNLLSSRSLLSLRAHTWAKEPTFRRSSKVRMSSVPMSYTCFHSLLLLDQKHTPQSILSVHIRLPPPYSQTKSNQSSHRFHPSMPVIDSILIPLLEFTKKNKRIYSS